MLGKQASDRFFQRFPALAHLRVIEEAHAFVVAGAVQNLLQGGRPNVDRSADRLHNEPGRRRSRRGLALVVEGSHEGLQVLTVQPPLGAVSGANQDTTENLLFLREEGSQDEVGPVAPT